MIDLPVFWKFCISIIYDILDLTIFRIPFIGSLADMFQVGFSVWLWGASGLIASVELLDPTDQIDSFLPSMTIAGIIAYLTDNGIDVKDIKKSRSAIK